MENLLKMELAAAIGIFVIAIYELAALLVARRRGLTKNVSRLVTHLLVILLVVGYAIYSYVWTGFVTNTELSMQVQTWQLSNWPFLVLSVVVGILIYYELDGVYRARKAGLTKNVSRFVTHGIMLVLFAVLCWFSLKKWDYYVKNLSSTYQPQMDIPVKKK